MAYFHTNYDASNLMVSVDDAEVTRALGVLGNKTPAALKVAVNTTARQTRKLMLTEVKKRYDLNAAGRRMIEDLRQRQKATNRRPTAILAIMKNDPGAFRADPGPETTPLCNPNPIIISSNCQVYLCKAPLQLSSCTDISRLHTADRS